MSGGLDPREVACCVRPSDGQLFRSPSRPGPGVVSFAKEYLGDFQWAVAADVSIDLAVCDEPKFEPSRYWGAEASIQPGWDG